MSSPSLPAAPPSNPGFPQNPFPITFKGFETLNTKPRRPGIKDQEMYWCDGFMPIGESNCRTLYGLGSSLYTTPNTGTQPILYFGFAQLPTSLAFGYAVTQHTIVVLGDGSAVDVQAGVTTTILPAGSLPLFPIGAMAIGQWANQYAIITCRTTTDGAGTVYGQNAYWLYDGTSVFGAGTLSPQVDILDGGSGYSSAPTITARGGSGTGATFQATVTAGSVTSVKVTNPGSGYLVNEEVILTVSGGGQDQAYGTATILTTAGVASVYVTAGGTGYSSQTKAQLSGGGGSGATLNIVGSNGTITGITVVNPGTGYTSVPSVVITDPASTPGSGASAIAYLAKGQISVTLVNGGSGYDTPPTVTVLGDGVGAVVAATIDTSASNVTSLQVINPGTGYTRAGIQFTGGNNAASVTTTLMPFGIGGSTVESYQGRVWLGNGRNGYVSSPGSPSDFSPANGAVFFQATDPFLTYRYVGFKQTNGFLYLLGDGSISAISGVNTSGNPPITTFNNQNVDPQIGITAFNVQGPSGESLGNSADSMAVLSRNIVFINRNGVYVSYGGSVTKVSDELDGLSISGNNSCAIANLFGIEVFMFLGSVIDTQTGSTTSKLFMWTGKKWFTSNQNWPNGYNSATFIASDPFFTAYGTDGVNIYPMFTTPTSAFTKVIQSKLWVSPALYFKKTVTQVFATIYISTAENTTNSLYVDSDPGFRNQSAATTSSNNVSSAGLYIFTNPVNWFGQYIGTTFSTTAKDITLIEIALFGNIQQSLVR